MTYNSTITTHTAEGDLVSTFVAEVDREGYILRSNAVQFTGLEGSRAYGAYLLDSLTGFCGIATLAVHRDGCEGYRRTISGLALPPAYTEGGRA